MTEVMLSPEELAWDEFVAGHVHGHVLQTSRWARLKTAFGWTAERVSLGERGRHGSIAAGASVLFRRLPWGQTVAYVPKGPVVDWTDASQVEGVLSLLLAACRRKRAALLKIEPDLPESEGLATQLTACGFRRSEHRVQPLSTIEIGLTGSDEEILARMKPKWRYNIRLAERKGVQVREGTCDDLPQIHRLLETTGQRDGFAVHSLPYYQLASELFLGAGIAAWLIAEHDGQILAAIAPFALGPNAWYMWGASSDEGRNLMPNHALQWAGMLWARERGCAEYDLWGIPDEVGARPDAYADPESWGQDGLWGVYRFKQGFGGRVVRFAGAWDLPISRPGYELYRLALRVRGARGEQA